MKKKYNQFDNSETTTKGMIFKPEPREDVKHEHKYQSANVVKTGDSERYYVVGALFCECGDIKAIKIE
jgi:hypothetical protein